MLELVLQWPLGPASPRQWLVRIADGDEYAEAETDWSSWFWLAGRITSGGAYPAEVGEDVVVAFEMPIGDVEMKRIVNRGRSLASTTCKSLWIAEASSPRKCYIWNSAQKDLVGGGLLSRLDVTLSRRISLSGA